VKWRLTPANHNPGETVITSPTVIVERRVEALKVSTLEEEGNND